MANPPSSLGAGSSPAGSAPAGFDLGQTWSAGPVAKRPPMALHFDPRTRAHVMNTDGTLAEVHPVDQAVALALGIEARSIKSVPNLGHGLRSIRTSAGDPALQRKVRDDVTQRLAVLIDAGDVALLDVYGSSPARGRLEAFVTYENLRTKIVQKAPVT